MADHKARVVAAARSWIGTPYHDQASIKGVGADCLGLARGIWREVIGQEPLDVPPYTRDWGETRADEVLEMGELDWLVQEPIAGAGRGSVVLFRMVPNAIAKHVGILTGEGTFVHAYFGLGVIEEEVTRAWQRRLAFSFQFPEPGENQKEP